MYNTETTQRNHINQISYGGTEKPLYNESTHCIMSLRQLPSFQVFHIKTTTLLATWNVRTLYQCGKLEKVMKEIIKSKIDILGSCEVRWARNGSC